MEQIIRVEKISKTELRAEIKGELIDVSLAFLSLCSQFKHTLEEMAGEKWADESIEKLKEAVVDGTEESAKKYAKSITKIMAYKDMKEMFEND